MGKVVYISDIPSSTHFKLFENEPDVMNVSKAAELLDVAKATIYREINRGNLEAIHVGSSLRISKAALLRYIGEVQDAG